MHKQKQPTIAKSTPPIPPPTQTATNTNNVNPWTNKVKIRGEGLLNSIMNKYLNDNDEEECLGKVEESWYKGASSEDYQKEYIELAEKIRRKYQVRNNIDKNMKPLFELQARCTKIDQLLEWLQKIQNRTNTTQTPPQPNQPSKNPSLKPIDTSFIYLPLHSETIFHEILADCINRDKGKGIGEYRNMKLKGKIEEINEVHSENLGEVLERNIL